MKRPAGLVTAKNTDQHRPTRDEEKVSGGLDEVGDYRKSMRIGRRAKAEEKWDAGELFSPRSRSSASLEVTSQKMTKKFMSRMPTPGEQILKARCRILPFLANTHVPQFFCKHLDLPSAPGPRSKARAAFTSTRVASPWKTQSNIRMVCCPTH